MKTFTCVTAAALMASASAFAPVTNSRATTARAAASDLEGLLGVGPETGNKIVSDTFVSCYVGCVVFRLCGVWIFSIIEWNRLGPLFVSHNPILLNHSEHGHVAVYIDGYGCASASSSAFLHGIANQPTNQPTNQPPLPKYHQHHCSLTLLVWHNGHPPTFCARPNSPTDAVPCSPPSDGYGQPL